jgi:LmbE family N-acetylglucosaminyl deacetylase
LTNELITKSGSVCLPARSWIGVFAHPDDEWVAGWPVFQESGIHKGVIFFVGDNRGIKEQHVEGSGEWQVALTRVLNALDIEFLGCLNLEPDFYKSPRAKRRTFVDHLLSLLEKARNGLFSDASIITHNPVGEYGHPDHITVFDTVIQADFSNDVYITDICYERPLSPLQIKLFYKTLEPGSFYPDFEQWEKAVNLYKAEYRWTWSMRPTNEIARLYRL